MGRDALIQVLGGEPHHGQVRSLQRSSSPWPGRCKLGISHYLQSPNCPSGTCKKSAVGGTLVRIWVVAAACNSRSVQLPSVLYVGRSDFWSSDVVHPLKSFTHSFKLVGMSLCCDVIFPGTGDRRPLSWTGPISSWTVISAYPGVARRRPPLHRRGGYHQQADGGLVSSAVHSMKYPDFYTLARHKCLELVVLFSSLAHMTFNHSCNSPLVCYRRSRTMVDRETGTKRASAGFCFFLSPSVPSLGLCVPSCLAKRDDPEVVADGFTVLTSHGRAGKMARRRVG